MFSIRPTPLLSRDATTQEGFRDFQEEASTLVSLSDLKHPLAVLGNHFRCNGNRVLRPDLWEISGTITKTMAFQSSPSKWTKVMEPAQKSDFSQLRLENTQKHLSPTDMLRLFSSDYPWPWEHLLSQWISHVIALNYLVIMSDNFIPKGPKELHFD